MNERIRELKRQAMLFAQEKCDGQTTDMRGNLRSDIWTEKFAELIVRECASFVNEFATNGDVRTGNDLLEHFGVEE
jgi:hypothetical protein